MAISASLVKELRERTGAGMMECKKALLETDGDIEAAIELMRKTGQAKAAKKAGRIAAEGVIVVKVAADNKGAVVAEINCETDFVAKDTSFAAFADAVAERLLASDAESVDEVVGGPLRDGDPATVEQARESLVAKLGENIAVRRFVRYRSAAGSLYSYRHGVRIGVLIEIEGGDVTLGKDLAMHIAASNPLCVASGDVAPETLEKEREIYRAQVAASGKPENIIDKIVEGRMRKYLEEVTLVGQPFVKDPEITVATLLSRSGAQVLRFARLEVGEGIERRSENFADEVMAQVRGV